MRLIFTCCHPALSAEAHIALALREVCGLSTQAVARAFLVSEEIVAPRLVRAEKKIRDAGIPYEKAAAIFNPRIQGVLAVVYGVFTEGYAATSGSASRKEDTDWPQIVGLYEELGRAREARQAYETALVLATREPERRLLMARIASTEGLGAET